MARGLEAAKVRHRLGLRLLEIGLQLGKGVQIFSGSMM